MPSDALSVLRDSSPLAAADAVEAHLLSGGSPGEGRVTLVTDDLQVKNTFLPGEYHRELWRPAGTLLIGHKHKTDHECRLLSGRLNVYSEGRVTRYRAGDVWQAKAGFRKATYCPDDCSEGATLVTIHKTDTTDLSVLEDELIEKSAPFKQFQLQHFQEALK